MNSCRPTPCQTSQSQKCGCGSVVKGCSTAPCEKKQREEENAPTIPAVDIIEGDNEFLIVADMPGAEEERVNVQFNAGELTITGQVNDLQDGEDVIYRCQQFVPNGYYRVFRIGDSINSDAISANFDNGVLTVRLPKRDEIQPKKIAVHKK